MIGGSPHFHGLIFQWGQKLPEPLLILECAFLSNQITKTITTGSEVMSQLIMKARYQILSLLGKDFSVIFISVTSIYLEVILIQLPVQQPLRAVMKVTSALCRPSLEGRSCLPYLIGNIQGSACHVPQFLFRMSLGFL